MILQKLTMKNFRQFKGTQTLEFASEPAGRNVTVIFGENGRGKTGIFRAIVFCLFGDRGLSQDGDASDTELALVNKFALHEAERGQPVDGYAELDFSHANRRYSLKRSLQAMLVDDGRMVEQVDEVRMRLVDESGNSRTVSEPGDVEREVNAILDRRVKEYFLFDGEKIERLTRASAEQRSEVSRGVRKLLNVDALEAAISAARKLMMSLENELADKSTVELARLIREIGQNEELQEQLNRRMEQLDDEVSKATTEKTKIEKELAKLEGIRELLDRRKELDEQLRTFEGEADQLLLDMRVSTGPAASLLVSEVIDAVFAHINERKLKGEIPPEIRRDLIERILEDRTCICGREVREGTDPHVQILEWLNKTLDSPLQESALELWGMLSEARGRMENLLPTVYGHLHRYVNVKNSMESIHRKLVDVGDQIGTSERADAGDLERQRGKVEDLIIKMEAERQNLQTERVELVRAHDRLVAQREEKEAEASRNDELSRRARLARDTHQALRSIHDEFTQQVRELLGEAATRFLRKLLDDESSRILRSVVVNNDYSLEVVDRWNKPFLANISAGQRQVTSIAFIAALAKMAAGSAALEMPLFMDTPFGRLSHEHRRRLIREVPNFSSQWVLLATDTEFGRQEASMLSTGERWGKFYILRAAEDGSSIIEERDVSQALAVVTREEAIA